MLQKDQKSGALEPCLKIQPLARALPKRSHLVFDIFHLVCLKKLQQSFGFTFGVHSWVAFLPIPQAEFSLRQFSKAQGYGIIR